MTDQEIKSTLFEGCTLLLRNYKEHERKSAKIEDSKMDSSEDENDNMIIEVTKKNDQQKIQCEIL